MAKPHFRLGSLSSIVALRLQPKTITSLPSFRHYYSEMASAAKHVLNDPATLVVDSLKGLATLNPDIKLDEASRGESSLKMMRSADV
jgi:hypothetical protein